MISNSAVCRLQHIYQHNMINLNINKQNIEVIHYYIEGHRYDLHGYAIILITQLTMSIYDNNLRLRLMCEEISLL